MPVITSGSEKIYVELYILKHIRVSATKVDPFFFYEKKKKEKRFLYIIHKID